MGNKNKLKVFRSGSYIIVKCPKCPKPLMIYREADYKVDFNVLLLVKSCPHYSIVKKTIDEETVKKLDEHTIIDFIKSITPENTELYEAFGNTIYFIVKKGE